jgi:hypothetical protein
MVMTFERTKIILNKPYSLEELAQFAYPPPPFQEVEVYDIADDPLERNNIVLSKSALASRCAGTMHELLEKEKARKGTTVIMEREVVEKLKALGYVH